MSEPSIGTPERPLYFMHIPKTAGLSLRRLLEDVFPVGAVYPHWHLDVLRADRGGAGYGVVCGHYGLFPLTTMQPPPITICVLREPAARAWSHYRALRELGLLRRAWPDGDPTFAEVLADPRSAWLGADHQARWLAIDPGDGRGGPEPLVTRGDRHVSGPLPFAASELEDRAIATLERCDLVGTTDRLDDVVTALGRLLGRWLPAPPRINVGSGPAGPPDAEAATVRGASTIDLRLLERADRLLDRALAQLPEPPPEPRVAGRYRVGMAEPLTGTGWHARIHTDDAGWHRWSGPGTRSMMRLGARMSGPARLDVAIVSACADDVLRSLRLRVQGRPVAHVLEPRQFGVAAIADVDLDGERPLVLELDVDRTEHLRDAAGRESEDPAGLAVGDVSLVALE